MSDEVAWCEIENASYTADLHLWAGLCSPEPMGGSPAPTFGAKTVLELGAGVGRVSIPLRALGVDVWALDSEQELLDEIVRRAQARGVGEISPIRADARSDISLGPRFDLVIAPQVFLQMFEMRADRVAIMRCAARHLSRVDGSSFWMTFNPDLEQAWGDEEDDSAPATRDGNRRTHLRDPAVGELLVPPRRRAIASDRLVAAGRR